MEGSHVYSGRQEGVEGSMSAQVDKREWRGPCLLR